MQIIAVSCIGFIMDCILGDPVWLPHPVCLIGWWISRLEQYLRRLFPQTPKGERAAGAVMVVLVLLLTGGVSAAVLWGSTRISPQLCIVVASIMCWQTVAAKCLKSEAMKVQQALEKNDLPGARQRISMLVGRDTQQLEHTQVAKAAVETVAENTSDGVVAPLFWTMLCGPVGGMLYKAINTMDSMVGYKNDRYQYFGTWAARLDDLVNWLPARLTALAMIAAAFVLRLDGNGAWRIWRRDRRKHASPNSAHPEPACAGALQIQLAGNASYFGKVYEKPYIGDPIRPIEPGDINRSCRLMYAASLFALAVFTVIRFILIAL